VDLILFRHGIAIDRSEPGCPSEENRFLTTEGDRRTHLSARGLRALGIKPTRIVSSPLVRTMQTAAIAAEELDCDLNAVEEWPELVYWESPEITVERLRTLQDDSVLVVGHRPHLDELLAAILGFEDESFTTLKKAGAALLDWRGHSAELRWLMTPKALRFLTTGR
jgi:phosphohistidine phosphatase